MRRAKAKKSASLSRPDYLTMPRGTPLPENVRRLARGIAEYDGVEDAPLATRRLLEQAQAAGDIPE